MIIMASLIPTILQSYNIINSAHKEVTVGPTLDFVPYYIHPVVHRRGRVGGGRIFKGIFMTPFEILTYRFAAGKPLHLSLA